MAHKKERVSSCYAEIYLNDSSSTTSSYQSEKSVAELKKQNIEQQDNEQWISPSDTLIGLVELQPPFTSKITRGKTHEGIIKIGNDVLEKEYKRFLKSLNSSISDNNAAWELILNDEIDRVKQKVKDVFKIKLAEKNKIITNELNKFYESNLQELETNLRTEVKSVLISCHADIVTDFQSQIKTKLKKEKEILNKLLKDKYEDEVNKVKKYYEILLKDDIVKNNNFIRDLIISRNDALKAFYRQIEAKSTTTSMYVMSTERKVCKIKKIFLENIHSLELKEKLKIVKEKKEYLKLMKNKEKTINEVNELWEERITKILKLFLRFISYSLKLLPEQSTFLLDFQKLVVLQINEIQKMKKNATTILLDIDDPPFEFEFLKEDEFVEECTKSPFVLEGDPSDIPPKVYGSSETLPPDVELPMIRVQRQYVYAKCNKFEDVKNLLESQKCHCHDLFQPTALSCSSSSLLTSNTKDANSDIEGEPSLESLVIDDFIRMRECPTKNCQNWINAKPFPDLNSYLDYSEENFERVKTIIGTSFKKDTLPQIIKATDISHLPLPFAETGEKSFEVATQYSSQEDMRIPLVHPSCPCFSGANTIKQTELNSKGYLNLHPEDVFMRRQTSLRNLLQRHPNLLKIFTDESNDFRL